jgi:heptosyltransferase I
MSLTRLSFNRILIIKPSSLGDILHALPVLHGLRTRYPQAKISWLVGRSFVEIIDQHPDLDEVIPFDRARFGRMTRSPRIGREFLQFLQEIRNRRFDLVIDLQGLFRSGFLARASGASVRIGPSIAREMAWLFYTHRIPVSDLETHAVDKNYRVAELLGFTDVDVQIRLPVKPQSATVLAAKLRNASLSDREPYAAVAPSARWETKMWPPERFASIIKALFQNHGLRSVLLGSPDEAESARQVMADCPPQTIDLSGKTTVPELVAALAAARIVICNDSGPMHIAAALDRPLVAVFGPTNPVRTGPYGRMTSVMRPPVDCAPCYLKKLAQCPYHLRCMKDLSVDRVLAAVEAALADNPGLSSALPRESADMARTNANQPGAQPCNR